MDCTNKNCPAYAKCLASYRGSKCKATRATYGLGDPLTNADRIRAMTDEELAQFIWDAMDMICPDNCYEYPERLCAVCILDWLKQEVTND